VSFITVLRGLAALSWLALVGVIIFAVVRATRDRSVKGSVTMIVIVLAVALVMNVLSAGLVFVEPTERGVVISMVPGQQGVRKQALMPGLNWIVPYFDRVITYPISRQTYTMSIATEEGQRMGDDSVESRTADGQVVYVDASVIFAIDPTEVVNVHISWQDNYVDGLVRPLCRGIVRDAVSSYKVEEVYSTKRAALIADISAEVERKFEEEGFLLVDFVLRNIAFSDEYAAVIESKQIAEQKVLEEQFIVQQKEQQALQTVAIADGEAKASVKRAEGDAQALLIAANAEAQARLIKAQAEAQALQLLGQAIATNPDVLSLEYIQQLAPNIQVMLLPSDNPFLLPLPNYSPQ
jgi:regulator of protease activity HflC (stomatin/prohibitin superfamily)